LLLLKAIITLDNIANEIEFIYIAGKLTGPPLEECLSLAHECCCSKKAHENIANEMEYITGKKTGPPLVECLS
jgi:hypothetical protein